MQRISRILLLVIAFGLVFALVWPRVRIWIRIDVSLWQALLLFGGAAFVLFLVLDHFINRSRD